MQPPFISHSINYEDVLLRRFFRDRPVGFYVDVGAAHPIDDSDTYALHRSGWSGINIEPNPTFFRALQAERPDDCNLDVALSDTEGALDWFQVGETGLSTCDAAEADRAAAKGYAITRHGVTAMTLAGVLARERPARIDLLKVDVEGFEDRVLAGNDWELWRPSLIVVEATFPESSERRPDTLTAYLEPRGYRRAHFDGLNDWFVETSAVIAADVFLPPNVFDNFVRRAEASATQDAAQLRTGTQRAEAYAESLRSGLEAARSHNAALDGELAAVRAALADATGYARSVEERAAALDKQLQSDQVALQRLHAACSAAQARADELAQTVATAEHSAERVLAQLTRERERLADAAEDVARSRAHACALLDRQAALGVAYERLLLSAKLASDERDRAVAGQHALASEAAVVSARLAQFDNAAAGLRDRADLLRAELTEAVRWRDAMARSTSWRVTRPVRGALRWLGRR